MIIDAHTHLGRPGGALNSRAVDLLKSMDAAGIDKALVFAGRINSITTEQVIEEIAPHKDRLFAVASVSPMPIQTSDAGLVQGPSELSFKFEEWLASGLVRGLKFYPGYEPFYPADPWLRFPLAVAAKYNRPAIFHSGDTFSGVKGAKLKYALPIHIDDLATDMPDLKIVIAHLGYPWQRDAAEVVYKNKNVYADCSGFVYGDFDEGSAENFRRTLIEFVSIAGSDDKILFGTDWPISNQKSYVETVQAIMRLSNHMMHRNAEDLFGI